MDLKAAAITAIFLFVFFSYKQEKILILKETRCGIFMDAS